LAFATLAVSAVAAAAYAPPEQVGTITAKALPEVSGMTAASVVPGGWWVVNDSGHTPDLHLIGANGRLLATVPVRGAANGDWEDLASIPGPAGRRVLFVGDIGDNAHVRNDLVVYRVPEPARGARGATATALPFRYPDGRHNAEALFVDPAASRIYVVTKREETATALYRFPLPLRPGRRVTLERVGGASAKGIAQLPAVTGAALSSDGTRLAIRTYWEAFEWRRNPRARFESLFKVTPANVTLALERQGESIAYTSDGTALVTTSEQLPAPLWRLNGEPGG
jgi:hypothetical protein